MFCPGCGNEILDGQKFCPKCGNTLENGTVAIKNTAPVWESKVVQVAPSYEDETIDEYQTFGWELRSSQTIDKQDSHLENQFGTIYSVTETEKYVKLTFRRNKKMLNYEKLVELENRYHSTKDFYIPSEPSQWKKIAGICLICFSVAMFRFLFVMGLFVMAGGIFLIYSHNKAKKEYERDYDKYVSASNENSQIKYACLAEAEKLMNS